MLKIIEGSQELADLRSRIVRLEAEKEGLRDLVRELESLNSTTLEAFHQMSALLPRLATPEEQRSFDELVALADLIRRSFYERQARVTFQSDEVKRLRREREHEQWMMDRGYERVFPDTKQSNPYFYTPRWRKKATSLPAEGNAGASDTPT